MSDDATPRLGLPYLAASQAQKHVILNEALSRLDGLVQTAVASRTLADQPAEPADGALYILPDDATGVAWAGRAAGTVMRFEAGGWLAFPVSAGQAAWIVDEARLAVFDGEDWVEVGGADLANVPLLGVGTTADADNPLAARLNKVLLTARPAAEGGDGDLRLTLNKEAAGDTASLLFQSGYGGRAEIGLTGSDDLTLKVSADGAIWREALSIARETGKATFGLSPLRAAEVSVFTAGGSYAVPAWARRLTLVCIGAGGGGGSGAAGTNAANRGGGAGGGAGGRASEDIDVAELGGATLTVAVGAAGAGGAGVTGTVSGQAGAAGGESSIADGGQVLLAATGGLGGGAGTTSNSTGGAGGFGQVPGNAGGAGSTAGVPTAGGDSACGDGPGAGGGGGGLNTGGATTSGREGGHGYLIGSATGRRATRGSGGASGGAGSAGAAKAWQRGCGSGGGGGGGLASASGGAGGHGGAPGGGGGGGGATREAYTSGAGGDGARGEVWIIAIG
ncbi:MAG: DUF2793 domain-containing protein [Caulobacter sp.]|nr:DUF2793 domain-containing protein [Caulobacter sp.]